MDKCDNCNRHMILGNRKYNKKQHILICKKCMQVVTYYSKTSSKSKFLLDEPDFHNMKYIYIENPNNPTRLYLYDDIEKAIIKKYGDLEKMKDKRLVREKRKEELKEKSLSESEERKKDLIRVLKDHKLEYKNNGDCYSYVYHRKLSVKTVVENQIEENKR